MCRGLLRSLVQTHALLPLPASASGFRSFLNVSPVSVQLGHHSHSRTSFFHPQSLNTSCCWACWRAPKLAPCNRGAPVPTAETLGGVCVWEASQRKEPVPALWDSGRIALSCYPALPRGEPRALGYPSVSGWLLAKPMPVQVSLHLAVAAVVILPTNLYEGPGLGQLLFQALATRPRPHGGSVWMGEKNRK